MAGIKKTKLLGTTGRGAGCPVCATGIILGLWHLGQRYCIMTPQFKSMRYFNRNNKESKNTQNKIVKIFHKKKPLT